MGVIQTITEGGQLATHSVRMFKQVTKVAIFLAFAFWIGLFAYYMRETPSFYGEVLLYYVKAEIGQALGAETVEVERAFWRQLTGERIQERQGLPLEKVLVKTKPYAQKLYQVSLNRLKQAGIRAGGALSIVLIFFFFRGRQSKKKQHVKGNRLASVRMTALQLKFKRSASSLKLGSLPLVKGTETQHLLITGGTGSGKTNCLHHLLPQIRALGQRAIIVDTTGILTDIYYRPECDVLLNPFDARGSLWHPWRECVDATSYEAMAESFISQSHYENDNYWRTSARVVFSSLLQQLAYSQKNSELAEKLLRVSLKELCEFVKDTKAASQLDIHSEKTAASVRSVLSNFLNCFDFLQDTDDPFSIREWIRREEEKRWLFLTCKTNQRAALNPLLACWFSVAVRSLLELNPDFTRRLWFVIDELPTLNRLRDLEALLAESRKYGGCALLALQSPSQLEAIYGRENTQTILGNCATKIVFSEQNPAIASQICQIFGEREVKEYQKGLSYGANDIRDGVNLNLQVRYQPLITPSDIQFLPRNQAFVRLPDNYPVVKLKFPIAQLKGKTKC